MKFNRYLALAAAFACFTLAGEAQALTIVPTFVNAAGETWTADRQAVVNQAIDEWSAAILDNHTIEMDFTFASAGTSGYLGVWAGGGSFAVGTDIYPWTPGVNHEIRFNASLMDTNLDNYLWFDSTPTTDGDQPFAVWDALSVARHELAHALGFTSHLYVDNFSQGNEINKWTQHITGNTFDLNGLDVPMQPGNFSHVANSGIAAGDLMTTQLPNGQRVDISQLNLDMLALAYGYDVIPEPATLVMVLMPAAWVMMRRRAATA